MLLALELTEEVLVYKYDTKKIKSPPVLINRIKTLGESKFLLFLKDNVFGVFNPTNVIVYQVEDNNSVRLIFNRKYGVAQTMELLQVPKPIESLLNIFFKEKSVTSQIHTLWRMELDLKNISPSQNFKSMMRIYDIPNRLLG